MNPLNIQKATIYRYLEVVLLMPCQLGYNYQHISHLSYLQTTHEHGKAPCSFSLFSNSFVERLYLISLRMLFQRRLPRNKNGFIPCRVECAKGRCNIFPFLKSYGKTFILKQSHIKCGFKLFTDLNTSVTRKGRCF